MQSNGKGLTLMSGLTRGGFAARTHKVVMKVKALTTFKVSSPSR